MYIKRSLPFVVGYCNQLFYSRRKRFVYFNKRALCFTANSSMNGTSIIAGDVADIVSVFIVSVPAAKSSSLGSIPGQGHCVVFLCQALDSHRASLHFVYIILIQS